jgi:peptidoglycan/LPS O-acetylase OafA/YrhL
MFAALMLLEKYFKNRVLLALGQKTLTVYIIHFVILYGSWFGLSVYQLLYKSLNPWLVAIGAISFIILVSYLTLQMPLYKKQAAGYLKSKMSIKLRKRLAKSRLKSFL